jgi:hypothetical protein
VTVRASSFAAALVSLALALSACAQTVVLDDQAATGGDGGQSNVGDGSSDARCFASQAQQLPFKTLSPEVIVALDRSSAMNGDLSMALNALAAEVPNYQNLIRFGFVDFPDDLDTCANACCVGELTPPPMAATGTNYSLFEEAAYACNADSGGPSGLSCPTASQRPTEAALKACTAYYENDPQAFGRYVLLVTNGPPSGNCGDANGDCSDAESEVALLDSLNVQTVIVDLGDPSNDLCLHELAIEQGTDGAPYYYVPPADGLDDELKTITSAIATDACHLLLNAAPDDPSQVSITYDGMTIPRDDTDGWDFNPGSSVAITLNGSACQNLVRNRNGPLGLDVYYGCVPTHFGQP